MALHEQTLAAMARMGLTEAYLDDAYTKMSIDQLDVFLRTLDAVLYDEVPSAALQRKILRRVIETAIPTRAEVEERKRMQASMVEILNTQRF